MTSTALATALSPKTTVACRGTSVPFSPSRDMEEGDRTPANLSCVRLALVLLQRRADLLKEALEPIATHVAVGLSAEIKRAIQIEGKMPHAAEFFTQQRIDLRLHLPRRR